ncbi:MAG: transposase [Thaumarchaeota archaeon]|nr:transposase [Nitrososphaerota archaeon]
MLTYKFRLYPTIAQEKKLLGTLEACRYVYNYFVRNGYLTRNDMNYVLTELKEQKPWLNNYHSKMLQMVSTQVAGARKALKELRKKGYDVGALKFSKYDEYDTCVYNQSGFDIDTSDSTLYLSSIGKIKIRIHRSIIGAIKQIALKRRAGRWYACITTDNNYRMVVHSILKPVDFRKAVGIDVGITNYSYDSDGNATPNPENLKKMLKPLIRAQRKVSRRVKGSQNHRKARRWFQIVHERITNRRKDFLHKLSTHYASRYDVIFLERLKVLNMVQNHSLAMSIMDAAWSAFKGMVNYKAKLMLEVEPRDSTVDCSRCENKVPKSLAIRIHMCDRCGLVIDRDHNASLNILQRGLQSLGVPQELRELTPVEILMGSGKQEAHALRRG